MKKKNYKVRKNILTGIMLICLGVMAFSGFKLISTALEYKRGRDEYARLRQYTTAVEDTEETEAEATPTPTPTPKPEKTEIVMADDKPVEVEEEPEKSPNPYSSKKPPIAVDWAALKAINPDIVGWLYIGVLDISYPVVQGPDDDKYLHTTFEGQNNMSGTIFVEAANSADLGDPNTILYGHNMKDGSMFGKLHKLLEEKKCEEDPYFWILTPEGNYHYRMFNLSRTALDSNVYTLFNGTNTDFVLWCIEMLCNSEVRIKEEIFLKDSRIATLSTCTTDTGKRFVVQGVALEE
ncbi:MAG: class B sortase [Eubacteriales bacterium]|nr:class B sortase [Eubacteriales bacterium]